jgi:S-DNA-T family DNA segregation ATPase FtsK/SpoIIIE
MSERTKHDPNQGDSPLPLKPTWKDNTASFFKHVRSFGWDLLGTFVLVFVILSFLGVVKISQGLLITPWAEFLRRNFGWGIYPFLLLLGYLGAACFLYRAGKPTGLTFGRFLALEFSLFGILALLCVFAGGSLVRAESGLDGGRIGWGLTVLFWPKIPMFFVGFLYFILTVIFILAGIGELNNIYHRLLIWADSPTEEKPKQEIREEVKPVEQAPTAVDEDIQRQEKLIRSDWRDDRLPPLNLLVQDIQTPPDEKLIRLNAKKIENTLAEFGVPARVVGYRVGPSVTQYALEPGYIERPGPDGEPIRQKVRVSQISALTRDLTLALSAYRLRIETPVPGRSYVGIEVPNPNSDIVRLRSMLESPEFKKISSPLALALGRNVSGEPVVADLTKMPHLLIAGTTNSGKSVCITALTACLVMNNTPNNLRLVMLDPKMVELVRYNGLPHLLGNVETEPERMMAVLRWALVEMDSRYRAFETAHSRDLADYNMKMMRKKLPTLPHIVIMIDELADLMMSAPDQTERCLTRLGQMARATGIHLIVATQRPSTDVVTGLIKANLPARISFLVASAMDSRVILDANGAETLLGRGDMLFQDPQRSGLQRAQGVLVSDQEIDRIVDHWQSITTQPEEPAPWDSIVEEEKRAEEEGDSDEMIEQAIMVVKTAGRASISLLQRRLRIGFPRAGNILDELEKRGIVGPAVGSGKEREVLVHDDEDTSDENEYPA